MSLEAWRVKDKRFIQEWDLGLQIFVIVKLALPRESENRYPGLSDPNIQLTKPQIITNGEMLS